MTRPVVPSARDRAVALVVGIAATVAFVILRVFVAAGDHAPLDIDLRWHQLMTSSRSDAGVLIAWVPAIVGGTVGMIVVGVLLIAALALRRRRGDAATLAIAMIVVVAIGATMAAVIGRTRPSDSLAERMATSFPSGHTAVATTVCVILALALRRWYVWLIGGAWVLAMMWSRTYLGAHWLSDVVAGMLEGVAVAALVWIAVQAVRDQRALRSTTDTSDAPSTEGPLAHELH